MSSVMAPNWIVPVYNNEDWDTYNLPTNLFDQAKSFIKPTGESGDKNRTLDQGVCLIKKGTSHSRAYFLDVHLSQNLGRGCGKLAATNLMRQLGWK